MENFTKSMFTFAISAIGTPEGAMESLRAAFVPLAESVEFARSFKGAYGRLPTAEEVDRMVKSSARLGRAIDTASHWKTGVQKVSYEEITNRDVYDVARELRDLGIRGFSRRVVGGRRTKFLDPSILEKGAQGTVSWRSLTRKGSESSAWLAEAGVRSVWDYLIVLGCKPRAIVQFRRALRKNILRQEVLDPTRSGSFLFSMEGGPEVSVTPFEKISTLHKAEQEPLDRMRQRIQWKYYPVNPVDGGDPLSVTGVDPADNSWWSLQREASIGIAYEAGPLYFPGIGKMLGICVTKDADIPGMPYKRLSEQMVTLLNRIIPVEQEFRQLSMAVLHAEEKKDKAAVEAAKAALAPVEGNLNYLRSWKRIMVTMYRWYVDAATRNPQWFSVTTNGADKYGPVVVAYLPYEVVIATLPQWVQDSLRLPPEQEVLRFCLFHRVWDKDVEEGSNSFRILKEREKKYVEAAKRGCLYELRKAAQTVQPVLFKDLLRKFEDMFPNATEIPDLHDIHKQVVEAFLKGWRYLRV